MFRKRLYGYAVFVLGLLLLAALPLMAQNGKIRGKVTDSQTGEALPLANVVIEGTTRGAASDAQGEFIIPSVPPGTYTIRVSLLGYQATTFLNVKVNTDATTELNVQMSSEAIATQTVEVVSEQPLVNKSVTNTVAIVSGEELRQMPIRGVASVFTLAGGVVSQGGQFFVRGGRAEETAYYVDGVLANNPINGQLSLNVINNAIEEVQSQIGGMTAEYGNAMSGVVNTTSRTGGTKYNVTFEVISDEILGGKDSRNFLGAYSYGQSEYVITAGGPLVPGTKEYRFFVAGQRSFNRSGASFIDGIKWPITIKPEYITGINWSDSAGLPTPDLGTKSRGQYIADLLNTANLEGGRTRGGVNLDSWGANGNLFFDFGLVNVKVGGTYNTNTTLGGYGRDFGIVNYLANRTRGIKTVTDDMSGYAKFTFVLSPKSLLTANLNYFRFFQEQGDQIWFSDFEKYGDPTLPENAVLYQSGRNNYGNPPPFTVFSFSAAWPGSVPLTYFKLLRQNIGGRVDFVNQVTNEWELKLGGELTSYTIRNYQIDGRDLYSYRKQNPTANDWVAYNGAGVSFYGFDLYGNEFEGGSMRLRDTSLTIDLSEDGPRQPVFIGAYLQNKFEFEDLIMNLGIRFDMLDPGARRYKSLEVIEIDDVEGVRLVSKNSYVDAEKFTQVSPRLGFSFPVTDRTVFHATYGKFIQIGRLSDLYDSRMFAGFFFAGGFARQYPNPSLKPERTTSYEVGFKQQVGDFASFDLTFYYKDIRDLHVIRTIFPTEGSDVQSAYFTNVNGDYGTSKGFTLNFGMRRVERITVNGTYTLSYSTATGSSSRTHFNIAWQDNSYGGTAYFPVIPAPTDFDRTHTGNVNVDYRFEKDDGPEILGVRMLERLGVNLLVSFSSGVRYTRGQIDGAFAFSTINAPVAYESLNNSSGPWIYTLDLKVDKTLDMFGMADLNVYVWITNLLNRKNVYGVYKGTGSPNNDGWFQTIAGKEWVSTNGPEGEALYNYFQDNLGFYGAPRQVRLGLQLSM